MGFVYAQWKTKNTVTRLNEFVKYCFQRSHPKIHARLCSPFPTHPPAPTGRSYTSECAILQWELHPTNSPTVFSRAMHGRMGLPIWFLLQDWDLGIAHRVSKEVQNTIGLNKQEEEWMCQKVSVKIIFD